MVWCCIKIQPSALVIVGSYTGLPAGDAMPVDQLAFQARHKALGDCGFEPPSRTDRSQAIRFRSRKRARVALKSPLWSAGASSSVVFYLQNELFFE